MSDLKQRVERGINILQQAEQFMQPGEYYARISLKDAQKLNDLIKELQGKLLEVLGK
jgi:hypothetical protein